MRDFPKGVRKLPSGKYESRTKLGGKSRYIGTFDTPEQASAAYLSVRNNIEDAKLSAVGADEVVDVFDAAKKKAVEEERGYIKSWLGYIPGTKIITKITSERNLPLGVTLASSGEFASQIWWRGKQRYIGSFDIDTPEQASAAYVSARKGLDDANLLSFRPDEEDDLFDAAKKKALDTVQAIIDNN
jgi:hypothetical protein